MDSNEPRYAEYFDLTPQQFHDYKASKFTPINIVGSRINSIFDIQ